MSSTPVRLNLGCGGDVREGWINVDLYPCDSRVQKCDIRALPFTPGTVDEILAQDSLEHISHREAGEVLLHWLSLLRPGGTITIRSPDIERQCKALLDGTWSPWLFSHMMFGGQEVPGNEHRCGFTPEFMKQALISNGFKIVSCESNGTITSRHDSDNANFIITAVKI